MSLLENTRRLLQARLAEGVTVPQIVEESDGDFSREWLYKFLAEDIDNPGVKTVQSLHDRLKKIKPTKAN